LIQLAIPASPVASDEPTSVAPPSPLPLVTWPPSVEPPSVAAVPVFVDEEQALRRNNETTNREVARIDAA
jgi:hypothetical protein